MQKVKNISISMLAILALFSCVTNASRQAVNASGVAISQGVVASGQAVGSVIAAPLKVVGAVGKAADKVGDDLLKSMKDDDKFKIDKTPVIGNPPSIEDTK